MRPFSLSVLLVGLLAPVAVVRADVAPERPVNACDGHKAGDACGPAHVCRDSTCCHKQHVSVTIQHYESRKPRSEQNPNIIDPSETCSPCLACEASGPPAPTAPSPDVTGQTPPAPAPAAHGMCTITAGAGGPATTGLLLGALLGLAFVRRLRR